MLVLCPDSTTDRFRTGLGIICALCCSSSFMIDRAPNSPLTPAPWRCVFLSLASPGIVHSSDRDDVDSFMESGVWIVPQPFGVVHVLISSQAATLTAVPQRNPAELSANRGANSLTRARTAAMRCYFAFGIDAAGQDAQPHPF
jgi:hypothetical protein